MRDSHSRPDLAIGELARRTETKVETVRYYERVGLMPPPPRAEGGHRRYGREHVRRLGFIRRARGLGFSLDDIRHLLGLVDDDTLTCAEVHTTASTHLAAVRQRIDDLRHLEQVLGEVVGQCSRGRSPDCPVIDTLFDDPA